MKIEEINNIETHDWFNAEFDYRSLQIVLGMQDCCFDPEGVDQIAYDIYGKIDDATGKVLKAGHSDVHSATAFGVFYEPVNMELIEAIDDKGKVWKFHDETALKIRRKNIEGNFEELEIPGKDIDEEDEILDVLTGFKKY